MDTLRAWRVPSSQPLPGCRLHTAGQAPTGQPDVLLTPQGGKAVQCPCLALSGSVGWPQVLRVPPFTCRPLPGTSALPCFRVPPVCCWAASGPLHVPFLLLRHRWAHAPASVMTAWAAPPLLPTLPPASPFPAYICLPPALPSLQHELPRAGLVLVP